MARIAGVVLAAVLLSGCTTPHWEKPGVGYQEFSRDLQECDYLDRRTPLQGIYGRCMREKGYQWVR